MCLTRITALIGNTHKYLSLPTKPNPISLYHELFCEPDAKTLGFGFLAGWLQFFTEHQVMEQELLQRCGNPVGTGRSSVWFSAQAVVAARSEMVRARGAVKRGTGGILLGSSTLTREDRAPPPHVCPAP